MHEILIMCVDKSDMQYEWRHLVCLKCMAEFEIPRSEFVLSKQKDPCG